MVSICPFSFQSQQCEELQFIWGALLLESSGQDRGSLTPIEEPSLRSPLSLTEEPSPSDWGALPPWLRSSLSDHHGLLSSAEAAPLEELHTQEKTLGRYTLDSDNWTVTTGQWQLNSENWTLDTGQWILPIAHRTWNTKRYPPITERCLLPHVY